MAQEMYYISLGTLIIAILSFIISIITLKRDKINRGYDMLHNALILINTLNLKITDYMKIKNTTKNQQKQISSITTEYINQYCYLAFLINNKQINDLVAYRMGNKFIFNMFNSLKSRLNSDEHKEIFVLVKRWKKYPPTNIWNRFVSNIMGYYTCS
jgi:hypothetical protein